jgi:Uma2 family endonuclease
MKAVMPVAPDHFLEQRRLRGADQWDEMWNGVLHMPPAPNLRHQDFEGQLEMWLRWNWAAPFGNRVYHQINVASIGGWPNDYRIPDVILMTPDCFDIDRDTHVEGAPTVAVEIHSPGDEAYEKLDFYADLGMRETWIVHRDTRRIELYRLTNGEYVPVTADADGWLPSTATGLHLRQTDDQRLAMRVAGKPDTEARLPM